MPIRGRIIHYNPTEGKGLVGTGERQFPFEIGHWRSDVAPATNTVVDLDLEEDRVAGVRRVPDDVLLREKAGELASRLGALGGQAAAGEPADRARAASRSVVERLGKPALIAQGAFAAGALLLSFITINAGFGVSQSVSLARLSGLAGTLGSSVGSDVLVWAGIASVLVPVFWKHRLAWLALLVPLIATVKPAWDIRSQVNAISTGMGGDFSAAIADRMAEMVSPGTGAYLCAISALVLAGIGIKRFLVSSP